MTLDNLLFRRQFLITPHICTSFDHWQHKSIGHFHIYAHPDVELNVIETENKTSKMVLIGYMIDPNHPERSNVDILNDMIHSIDSIDSISRNLYSISGRFVLVVFASKGTFLFHDPCGLRTVYFTNYEGNTYVGSQPLLFQYVMPLSMGNRFFAYQRSDYKKSHIEHWIPSGCSLHENIQHLIPNHYLDFSTFTQKRYWPTQKLQARRLEDGVNEAAGLIQKLVQSAHKRFDLALPVTAGWDSRLLLSACRNIANDIFFYTLQYRKLQLQSSDIRIPRNLLRSLGYTHYVIDCRGAPDEEFYDVYERSTSISHKEDWGRIAYGMIKIYPSERVCLKGNCSEICRCFYYKSGMHHPISSPDEIAALEEGWKTLPFIIDQLSDWYYEVNTSTIETGVDMLDLFYWEHKMGSWQAQSQLERDIVHEVFTPFNHRGLLEMMLGVPSEFRCAPNYVLYRKMYEILWPEVMNQPINPPEDERDVSKDILPV